MATVANLAPTLIFKSWLSNGTPNAFGTVNTYSAGTVIPIATWTDVTAGTPNANPATLNVRGEMPMYLLPNVAYKIVETDSGGNSVRTTDNVVNNQLITLYGGVDTGSTNAYLVNFTANFSAYTDGIVIYFVPANTNTGASTINVNGLGVINILGPGGVNPIAGTIVGGYPIGLIYKGGSFYLISQDNPTSGSFAGTFTGLTGSPATTIRWTKNGNLVTLNLSGTSSFSTVSNATSMAMTGIPSALSPVQTTSTQFFAGVDNSANLTAPCGCFIIGGTTTITFTKDLSTGGTSGWTASGSKGFNGGFILSYFLT
jgi:hypothetical protein